MPTRGFNRARPHSVCVGGGGRTGNIAAQWLAASLLLVATKRGGVAQVRNQKSKYTWLVVNRFVGSTAAHLGDHSCWCKGSMWVGVMAVQLECQLAWCAQSQRHFGAATDVCPVMWETCWDLLQRAHAPPLLAAVTPHRHKQQCISTAHARFALQPLSACWLCTAVSAAAIAVGYRHTYIR